MVKRRSPGAQPPTLTPQQLADAQRCLPIAAQLAAYYAARRPLGLKYEDLVSVANLAVPVAVGTYDASKGPLEAYVWLRVRGTLLNLIEKTAKQLGVRSPSETPESRTARAGKDALELYALTLEDPGDVWEDTEDEQTKQYRDVAGEGGAALALGAAGHAWHMRGNEGYVQRAEYVRAMRHLREEVAGLPAANATVVELRFFQGLQVDEVASKAGVSEPKVTRLLGKAVKLLKARLEAHGITDLSVLEGR
jgi:RNA polymerase sigma factor (sigma-70 family)